MQDWCNDSMQPFQGYGESLNLLSCTKNKYWKCVRVAYRNGLLNRWA